ncbi:unnamed protein product [Clonostachys rosea]|uniref:Uncharacterized protein n=1 Tax=Bionectria ochroleuca TaxID=29856 RepID=A0ABY6UF85_BIOOC|nr:unnamed protein product [Clonostachys rosea]
MPQKNANDGRGRPTPKPDGDSEATMPAGPSTAPRGRAGARGAGRRQRDEAAKKKKKQSRSGDDSRGEAPADPVADSSSATSPILAQQPTPIPQAIDDVLPGTLGITERAQLWKENICHDELYKTVHLEVFPAIARYIGVLATSYVRPAPACPNKSLWEHLDDGTRQKLIEIHPQAAKLMDGGYYAPRALFQAYVWRVLNARLFTANDKWATPAWATHGQHCTICDSLDHEGSAAQASYNGIFLMARILRVQQGEHVKHAWLKKILRETIQPFLDIAEYDEEEEKKELGLDGLVNLANLTGTLNHILNDLAQAAISADFALISSPYRMKLGFQDPETGHSIGFCFRGADMDSIFDYPEDGCIVDFVVAPMLRTYGPSRPVPFDTDEWPLYFASSDGGYRTSLYKPFNLQVFVSLSSEP